MADLNNRRQAERDATRDAERSEWVNMLWGDGSASAVKDWLHGQCRPFASTARRILAERRANGTLD